MEEGDVVSAHMEEVDVYSGGLKLKIGPKINLPYVFLGLNRGHSILNI